MNAICLNCKEKIPLLRNNETGKYHCRCGHTIPYENGIYRFIKEDKFYEGRFSTTKLETLDSWWKSFGMKIIEFFSIAGEEQRTWKKAIKIIKRRKIKPLLMLNIGAGGGHQFLKELGIVISVDLSFSSLLAAKKVSDYCYQADAANLPFKDNTFDLCFSSHFLGHISLGNNLKQRVINEIYRVTKKGGFSLHSLECEADNFIFNRAKKYKDFYKKYFIEMYGHYGLELPSITKKRFRDANFRPIFERSDYCNGIIRPVNSYKVFFGNQEYRKKEKLFLYLFLFSNFMSSNFFVSAFFNILFYPLTIFNRFFGSDSVDSVKLFYFKP